MENHFNTTNDSFANIFNGVLIHPKSSAPDLQNMPGAGAPNRPPGPPPGKKSLFTYM